MRGYVAAGVVVAMTVLAGCTDEPEPRFDDPTETPSASPSTPAAEEPEPWEEKSKAGAVAFAEHWIEVLNEAQRSGDTARLLESSAKGCTSCSDIADQLEAIYEDGGSVQTSGWKVLQAAAPPGSLSSDLDIVLRIDRPSQRVTNGAGKVERFGGDKATFSLSLTWRGQRWLVEELTRL